MTSCGSGAGAARTASARARPRREAVRGAEHRRRTGTLRPSGPQTRSTPARTRSTPARHARPRHAARQVQRACRAARRGLGARRRSEARSSRKQTARRRGSTAPLRPAQQFLLRTFARATPSRLSASAQPGGSSMRASLRWAMADCRGSRRRRRRRLLLLLLRLLVSVRAHGQVPERAGHARQVVGAPCSRSFSHGRGGGKEGRNRKRLGAGRHNVVRQSSEAALGPWRSFREWL